MILFGIEKKRTGDSPQVHWGYSKLSLVKRQERFAADLLYRHDVTNFRGLALKKSAPISEIRGCGFAFPPGLAGVKDVGNHQIRDIVPKFKSAAK